MWFYSESILVTTATDKEIKVWDCETGNLLGQVSTPGVTSASMSDSGQFLTSSSDGSLRVWDIDTILKVQQQPHTAVPNSLQATEKYFVSSNREEAVLWKWKTAEPVKVFQKSEAYGCPHLANDDSHVLVSHDKTVELYDIKKKESKEIYTTKGTSTQWCCLGSSSRIGAISEEDSVIVIDLESGSTLYSLPTSADRRMSWVTFFKSDQLLVSGAFAKLQAWRTNDKSEIISNNTLIGSPPLITENRPKGLIAYVASIPFSSRPAGIEIVQSDTFEKVKKLEGHKGQISVIKFTPDGNYLVSSSQKPDFNFKIWDSETFECVRVIEGHHQGSITGFAISPDSKFIFSVSEDQTAKLWTLHGEVISTFYYQSPLVAIAASPSFKKFAVSARDGRIVTLSVCD